MTEKAMFVRTLGGDVIRRAIKVPGVPCIPGKSPEMRPIPLLMHDEAYTWRNGDDLPLIVKIQ